MLQKSNNTKIRLKNSQNDLLGMPNIFFKLIFKPYAFNYKADICFGTNFSLFDKFTQLIFLFSHSSLNSILKENNFFFEINYNETLFFYSNFNIFSMSFLFKSNYCFIVPYNKLNSNYVKDYFIFSIYNITNIIKLLEVIFFLENGMSSGA